jgi:hypothetical protein
MTHKLTLHYAIINCGDGSAALTFLESEALAEFDQSDDNGWGEPCLGSISLESDSPIKVTEEIETKEMYLIRLFDNDDSRLEEFIEEFFPDGLPEFTVKTGKTRVDYVENSIYADGVFAGSVYRHPKESGDALLKELNELKDESN